MIERFKGPAGAKSLLDALCAQEIVRGDSLAAQALADAGSLVQYSAGDVLIAQDDADNDILFICAGRVEILVNGRRVALRTASQQVGEMALIDPSAVRAATVRALEITVVLRVSEAYFSTIADQIPQLWRLLARQLASRLRERNRLVRPTNTVPRLFIGSSAEALPIAREIQSSLSHDQLLTTLWTDGVFGPSRFTIEDLERELLDADFAALVLAADDKVTSRAEEYQAPRDNVILELGLFMGALGRTRTLLVTPRIDALKIPTDLLGLKPISYPPMPAGDLAACIAPVANEIRKLVVLLGPR